MGKEKEEAILELTRKNIDKACDVVSLLKDVVKAFSDCNLDKVNEIAAKMKQLEEESDEITKKIVLELTTGIILPVDRQDLLALAHDLDDIADWAEECARIIKESPFCIISEKLKPDLQNLTNATIQTVNKLREALFTMRSSMKKAIELTYEVNKLEEKVDDLELKLRKDLLQSESDIKVILTVKDLVAAIENVADAAEDTSDRARIIAMKYI